MKKLLYLPLAITLLISCNKEEEPVETCSDGIQNQDETGIDCGGTCQACPVECENITYSATGSSGINLLHGDDTLTVSHGTYSLAANVPDCATLTIKISEVTGGVWYYALGTTGGWHVSAFDAGQQFFEATPGSSLNDMPLDLSNMTGMIRIWYYEDGTESYDKTKIVVVQ